MHAANKYAIFDKYMQIFAIINAYRLRQFIFAPSRIVAFKAAWTQNYIYTIGERTIVVMQYFYSDLL